MNKNKKMNKGIGDILTIMVIVTVVLIAGVILYYLFTKDQVLKSPVQTTEQEISAAPVPTTSDSDEIEDMEVELDALDLGTIDNDIQILEQESLEL